MSGPAGQMTKGMSNAIKATPVILVALYWVGKWGARNGRPPEQTLEERLAQQSDSIKAVREYSKDFTQQIKDFENDGQEPGTNDLKRRAPPGTHR
jgi:hypothetical protein